MEDKDSNLLKLLKVRASNLRNKNTYLYKSKPLMLKNINKMRGEISQVEDLLDLNGINLKKNYKYFELKEGLLKAITDYGNGVDLIVERAKKEMDQEEERYSGQIRKLG